MKTQIYSRRDALFVAITLGVMTFCLTLLVSILLNFNLIQNLVLSWVMTTVYAIIAFFLVEKQTIINKEITRFVESPVYHALPSQVEKEVEFQTIDNPIIHVIEKPVEKKVYVEVPVEKKVFIEKPLKKLNISKYKFFGSDETMTYHKSSCRFRKLIKRKHQLTSNSEEFFKKRKFKKCKVCLGGRK